MYKFLKLRFLIIYSSKIIKPTYWIIKILSRIVLFPSTDLTQSNNVIKQSMMTLLSKLLSEVEMTLTVHGTSYGTTVHGTSDGTTVHGTSYGTTVHGTSYGTTVHGTSYGTTVHGTSYGTTVHGTSYGRRSKR